MEWKRARRDETLIAKRRTWESRCLRYRVQESVPKLTGLAKVFYALYFDTALNTWLIIGRHRTRRAAETNCLTHSKGSKR